MKMLFSTTTIPLFIFLLFSTCVKPKPLPIPSDLADSLDALPKELTLKEINPRILIGSPLEAEFDDKKYIHVFSNELSTGQALWYGRWGDRWVSEGKYEFTKFNNNINWMLTMGLSPTMHMLVGADGYMPDWLIKGNWEPEKLDSLLQDLIYNIMDTNDNKNKIAVWNVANELFDDDGTYRTNMLWNKLGWEADSSLLTGDEKINEKHPIFIRKAFTYCRNKTKNKLELRDFNLEGDSPYGWKDNKQKGFYQLIKHMLNTNIPIDAVGIQGHLVIGNSKWWFEGDALKNSVRKFKDLGLDVYITELDIRSDKKTWTPDLAQKQKTEYYNYIKQAIEGGATSIHLWGIQDGLDKGWYPDEHLLPWDENLDRKPAYYGVRQALIDTR